MMDKESYTRATLETLNLLEKWDGNDDTDLKSSVFAGMCTMMSALHNISPDKDIFLKSTNVAIELVMEEDSNDG